MQSDFLLCLLYQIDENQNSNITFFGWYAATLTFAEYRNKPFELFIRSQSQRFFNKFKLCLRNKSKEELTELFHKIQENQDNNYFGRSRVNFSYFTGIDKIATTP
jgi:hypothetical protein